MEGMKFRITIKSKSFAQLMNEAALYHNNGYVITDWYSVPVKFLCFTVRMEHYLVMTRLGTGDIFQRLQKAVEVENYELAARLRDQINGKV